MPNAPLVHGKAKSSPSPTTPTKSPTRRKRKKSADLSVGDDEDNRKSARRSPEKYKVKYTHGSDSDEDVVEFDNVHRETAKSSTSWGGPGPVSVHVPTRAVATAITMDKPHTLYQGRARLMRGDDTHWLSEADCYIRQELAEVFTAQEEDVALFADLEIGQVGIRCFYCAENKAPKDRNSSHCSFPSTVAGIQNAVSDLQRR